MKWAITSSSARAWEDGIDLADDETVVDTLPESLLRILESQFFRLPSPETAAQIIADERYKREIAGTDVIGVAVFTDRTTQMKLTGAAMRAQRDSAYTVDWKQSDGSFVTLSASQLIAIADAVGDYVQACYTREAALLDALKGGTYTEAMLDEGWP